MLKKRRNYNYLIFMEFDDILIDELLKKYVKEKQVIAFGSSEHGERFAKKLALKMEAEGFKVKVVPTSARIAEICHEMYIPTTTLNDDEVDIAIEFVDLVNEDFDFIKRDSHSLVRDKMIAQSAAELIIVTEKKNYMKRWFGKIPFEVTQFGWKHSLIELEKFGKANLRKKLMQPYTTESGNYIIDVEIDEIFDLDELEIATKRIPGVLESGLFIGYADRVLLQDEKKIEMKSRIQT